jgi:hypothetical protein
VKRFTIVKAPWFDVEDPFNMTPLGWAVARGHDAVARELLRRAGAAPTIGVC